MRFLNTKFVQAHAAFLFKILLHFSEILLDFIEESSLSLFDDFENNFEKIIEHIFTTKKKL